MNFMKNGFLNYCALLLSLNCNFKTTLGLDKQISDAINENR